MDKLQSALDRAAESIIPAKPNPEKAREIAKRYKTCLTFRYPALPSNVQLSAIGCAGNTLQTKVEFRTRRQSQTRRTPGEQKLSGDHDRNTYIGGNTQVIVKILSSSIGMGNCWSANPDFIMHSSLSPDLTCLNRFKEVCH